MKLLCAIALSLSFVATTSCKTEVAATVECTAADGPVVECSIVQTKGKAAMEVCWDFNITCANGATLKASGCGDVKDGGTTAVTIPTAEIAIEGACAGDTTAEVVNVKLQGK